MLEIRQLRYFLSAVRQGSLVAAAREHFVTQPAITLQLKKMESEFGEKLYARVGGRIVPTEAGRVLERQAQEIVERMDTLERSMQRIAGGMVGFLRMGNIDAASIYVLPAVFSEFRRRYPDIDIGVQGGDSGVLVDALEQGAIELAIVTLPLSGDNLEVVSFYEDEMVLVASPNDEIVVDRTARSRPLQAVAERGLITYPTDSTTRRLINSVFLDNGITLRAAMEMSSPEAIKRLTEAGLGASILPRKLVSPEVRAGTLRIIATGRASFSRTLGVVYKSHESLSEPAKNFLDILFRKFKKTGGRK